MAEAAAAHAGLVTGTGFVYRRQPAVAAIRDLVNSEFGAVSHFNGRYWCDYAGSPETPMAWRYKGAQGTGALADIGSHLIYLAEFLCGPMTAVAGAAFATRITERFVPIGNTYGHAKAELSDVREPVENDDVATFTTHFASGAVGTFSVSRIAPGHANSMAIDLLAADGAAKWDMDRPAEFSVIRKLRGDGFDGYNQVLVGPSHPYLKGGAPMDFPGVSYGVGDLFWFQARAFLEQVAGIEGGLPAVASFAVGVRDLTVIDAVTRSAAAGGAVDSHAFSPSLSRKTGCSDASVTARPLALIHTDGWMMAGMNENVRAARPPLRRLLTNAGYRRLWAARTVSQWGDIAQFTTLGLLLFSLTDSGLGVSGAVVAEIIPVLLLAPVAGALVDRLPRVRVMVAADLARMILAGTLAIWHEDASVAYLVAAGLSAGGVFFNPAASSILPSLVQEDELVTANSGIWTAAVTSQVLLAPATGLLAVTAGFGPAFAVNAASFAISALLLRGLVVPGGPQPVRAPRVLTHAREGLVALAAMPLLRALGAAQLLAALSAGATSALLVVLAKTALGTDGRGFGVLLGAIAVGALAGPWILTRLARDPLRPMFVFGPFALRGMVDLILAAASSVLAAAVGLVAYGVGTSAGSVTFTSLVQTQVPADLRGRAFAGFDFLWQSGRLVSLLAGGLLADRFGIRVVYVLGGALLLAAAGCGRWLSHTSTRIP